MGFSAAGFFGKLNDNIDDQRSYVRARVDEDRKYLRGEGLKRQAAIQKQRGTYEKVANDLIRRGADKRTVLGTLEMDPQGLLAVADRVNSDRNITTAGINSLFAVHDEYKGEATMEEILNKILPTIQKMPEGTDPVQAKKKSLGAFLGLDLEAELDNEVYGSHIVGGQTGDQIMTSMGLPVSASGTGGGVEYNLERTSSLSYGQAKPMIDLALSDYGPEWEAAELKKLDTATAAEGVTKVELKAIDEKRAFIEAGKGLTPAKRMEHLASRYGLGPQAEELYNKYGTTLFNVEFGFPSSLVDLMAGGLPQEAEEPVEEKPTRSEAEATSLTPMEVEEAAKSEAEALFKADPTKDSVDVTLLTGETITIPRSEIAKEEVPEDSTPPGLMSRSGNDIVDIKAARTAMTSKGKTVDETLESIVASRAETLSSLQKTFNSAATGVAGGVLIGEAWFDETAAKVIVALTGEVNSELKANMVSAKEKRELANQIFETGIVQTISDNLGDGERTPGTFDPKTALANDSSMKLFVDSVIKFSTEVQKNVEAFKKERAKETSADRIRDLDRQFIADSRNYPQGVQESISKLLEDVGSVEAEIYRNTLAGLADDAKAGRGLGRSSYMSDGTEPKLGY